MNLDAFKKIFVAYNSSLVNKASGIVGERYAEEIVQDTWLKLMQSWDSIRDFESIGSWLNRVVFNKSINKLRKEQLTLSLDQLFLSEDTPNPDIQNYFSSVSESPEHLASSQQTLLKAYAKWQVMPNNQKVAFNMGVIEGYNYQEIAKKLNVSLSNSKVILHRAKVALISVFHQTDLI